jgi:hypothetical protein
VGTNATQGFALAVTSTPVNAAAVVLVRSGHRVRFTFQQRIVARIHCAGNHSR